MKNILRVHHLTRFEVVRDNVYIIQFRSFMEKNQILNSGPWTFDNALLVLISPSVADRPDTMAFTHCSFWVQVHNISFKHLTRDVALLLGGAIGLVKEMGGEDTFCWIGTFVRIRLRTDI